MKRRPLAATFALLATLIFTTAPTVSAASDFPAGWEGYHTYAEIDAFLANTVATYGQGTGAIVQRRVIGQSYEGRDIWVLKISDRVNRNESEPEVLSECGMHARELLTVEMCLYTIELLTQNYGQSTPLGERVTKIVNTREIWIIPIVNPDGWEFNFSGGTIRNWRKNRQPTPGSDKIGIDLNRNWSYLWGCCGGSSANPGSGRYRGRFPFEAVENQVMRDFVLSRRVNGIQQIRAAFNWHSYGKRVMWPYGYTKEDIPPTMTAADHAALVEIGRNMAGMNGYKGQQGSDLYIYDGDFPAWAYGDQRIFVYTFEMYPGYGCDGCGGFKPPDDVIVAQTTVNRDAVLYFMEQADCAWRSVGLLKNCGPLYEDFEIDRAWTFDPFGSDDATGGEWERGIPGGTSDGAGPKQRGNVPSGQADLVTGREAGADVSANDVDGGTASARSRPFKLGKGNWTLEFNYTFAHDAGASDDDFLRVSVMNAGVATPVWVEPGFPGNRDAEWTTRTVSLNAWRGKTIRLLFEAHDGGADNILEAVVDDLRVYKP